MLYNFIVKMHLTYNNKTFANSLTMSPTASTQQPKGSDKKMQGYGHIRTKSHITSIERPPLKFEQNQYSQPCKILPPYYQSPKQKISAFILEQNNFTENIQLNWHPKIVRRPSSSYGKDGYSVSKQNSMKKDGFVKSKNAFITVTSFDTSTSDMETLCSKMTQSIIFSRDTIDSISEKPLLLQNQSFERIKFLGQGKFGQVYLVKHKESGFICAMKIIDKKTVRDQGVQMQIAKEIRIHNQMSSQNIINFYGYFDDSKNLYLLLQYATEGSVFAKLKGRSRLDEQEVQPIAKGLCEGLKFIHRMGFVHRDIKPQNVVLQFGVPKICDFGWATECDDLQMCKSYCGTPLYLSPQMVRKQFYGTSVDIWAIGLVVYELLVGRVPFKVWSQQDMGEILTKRVEFPEYIDRTDKCENFIRKCLQKQTYNRMHMNEALRDPFICEDEKHNDFQYQFIEQAQKVLTKTI